MTCEPVVIEQDVMFTDPVIMGFDPKALPAGDVLHEVFADPVARTLWLSWRPRHIVNQYFADEILLLAEMVKASRPQCGAELARLVRGRFTGPMTNFRSGSLERWADEVMPYLGGKTLSWTIWRSEVRHD